MIEYAANLGFHNWPIVKMMEERLGTKVKIEMMQTLRLLVNILLVQQKALKTLSLSHSEQV